MTATDTARTLEAARLDLFRVASLLKNYDWPPVLYPAHPKRPLFEQVCRESRGVVDRLRASLRLLDLPHCYGHLDNAWVHLDAADDDTVVNALACLERADGRLEIELLCLPEVSEDDGLTFDDAYPKRPQ